MERRLGLERVLIDREEAIVEDVGYQGSGCWVLKVRRVLATDGGCGVVLTAEDVLAKYARYFCIRQGSRWHLRVYASF